MDTIIIGIDWKHYQYFTEHIITAKEKSTKRSILIPGIWAKIRTMIGCSNMSKVSKVSGEKRRSWGVVISPVLIFITYPIHTTKATKKHSHTPSPVFLTQGGPVRTGGGTPSHGGGNPFVRKGDPFTRGGQPVRTGRWNRSYGKVNPFVRRGGPACTQGWPVRTGGGTLSYGKGTPFVRPRRKRWQSGRKI
jgi:hypothetical protein